MRSLTDEVLAELSKPLVRPFILCDIEFADQTIHVWSGIGDVVIQSNPALPIIDTQETNAGTWLLVTLEDEPLNPLAVGQQYELRGTTNYATWLDGVTVTVTDVPFPYQFRADYSHSNYGQTAETGTARLVGSITYHGLGNLGGISPISETTELQANGFALSLSGVDPAVVSEALAECRQGLPVTLRFGFMAADNTVIGDPFIIASGKMDTATVDEAAETCTITVTVESRLADLHRSRVRRFTDDDQQRTSPGDKGFQFVPLIQDWNINWGGKIAATK